jgi:acetoin utilization deacetylase AcuC-like enzyme
LIPTVYSPVYFAKTPTASMTKLPAVARMVESLGMARIIAPNVPIKDRLARLHAPEYVEAFLSGDGELAESNGWTWTPQIRSGVLAINSGQLRAAELAFEHRISANVAQGFHHARYAEGGGFCTFNGLALIAQEYPRKRILVIDCDEHQGNGTAEFTEHFPNLFNFTIYGTHYGGRPTNQSLEAQLPRVSRQFSLYEDALHTAFTFALDTSPDLIIYQAGMDCHKLDPLNTLGLSTKQIQRRDKMVFRFCAEMKIPCMFVLAGGYQIDESYLATLHSSTWQAALAAFPSRR